jgi:hypothetical protein
VPLLVEEACLADQLDVKRLAGVCEVVEIEGEG